MTEPTPTTRLAWLATWMKDIGPLALTLAGLTIYIAIRVPTSIFYGRLGTSPEEVGLGYTDLLVRSTLGLLAVAALASLILSLMVFSIAYLTLLPRIRAAQKTLYHAGDIFDESLADDEYEQVWGSWREAIATRVPELLEASGMTVDDVRARVDRRRCLAALDRRTATEEDELASLRAWRGRVSVSRLAFLAAKRIVARNWLLLASIAVAAVALIVLPYVAFHDSTRVQDGRSTMSTAFGMFPFRAESVSVVALENHPAHSIEDLVSSCKLMYLGTTAQYTVLYDSASDSVVKVPNGELMMVAR